MVMRPMASGRFRVVGGSYVHGICDSEAFLGPLLAFCKCIVPLESFLTETTHAHDKMESITSSS
jgi:hypothetical protein